MCATKKQERIREKMMKKRFTPKSLWVISTLALLFLCLLSPCTAFAKETEITGEILAEINNRLERAFKAGRAEADLSDMGIIVNMYSDKIGKQYQKILDAGEAFAEEHGFFVLGSHKESYIYPSPILKETEDCDKYGVGPNRVTGIGLGWDAFYRRADGSPDLKLIAATQKKVTQEYEYALSVVSDEMTDVEKALALYDYVIAMSNYPDAESIDENGIATYNSESYSAISVFRDNISVCVANATAYCYLLSDCGIPCIRVDSSGMEHSWAMVKVNGAWYHTDPTWDNPKYMDGWTSLGDVNNDIWDLGAAGHTYFLKSDQEMKDELQHYGWEISADYTKDGSVKKTPKSGPSDSFQLAFFGDNGYWTNDVHYHYVKGNWYFLNRVTNQIVKTALGRNPKKAEKLDAPTDNRMKFLYGSGKFLFICEDDGIWRYNTQSGEMVKLPLAENKAGRGQPVFTEMNIASGKHSLFAALERLMLHELDPMTVIDERVAGHTRFFLIGFAETAVNDEPFAVRAGRCLSFDCTYRNMPVDNTADCRVKPELAEDGIAYVLFVCQCEISSFAFFVGRFVGYEITLESGHAVFVVKRRELAFP